MFGFISFPENPVNSGSSKEAWSSLIYSKTSSRQEVITDITRKYSFAFYICPQVAALIHHCSLFIWKNILLNMKLIARTVLLKSSTMHSYSSLIINAVIYPLLCVFWLCINLSNEMEENAKEKEEDKLRILKLLVLIDSKTLLHGNLFLTVC